MLEIELQITLKRLIMNKLKHIIILSVLLFLGYSNANATHIAGLTIDWQEVSKDLYKVNVKLYRDCNGTTNLDHKLNVASTVGDSNYTLTFDSGKEITPLCNNQKSRCSDPNSNFRYGFILHEAYVYIDLSKERKAGNCEISLSLSHCCRNAYNNLGVENTNLYVETKMNICDSTRLDHSPIFLNDELNYLLVVGDDVEMSFEAYDKDGDSLVYEIVSPYQEAGKQVQMAGVFSPERPLNFLGFPKYDEALPSGFHFNEKNGLLRFRPMKQEQSIFVVKVDEYRNQKLIGSVMREVSLLMLKEKNSTSKAPQISAVKGINTLIDSMKIVACEGTEIQFDIETKDADQADSVRIDLVNNINGLEWELIDSSAQHQKARVTWTPEIGQASTVPYSIFINAFDNSCPFNLRTTRVVEIIVNPISNDSISLSDTTLCFDNKNSIIYLPKKVQGVSGVWEGLGLQNDSIGTFLNDTGAYSLKFIYKNTQACLSEYNREITITKADKITIEDDTICLSGILLYTPKSNATLNSIVGDAVNGINIEFTSKNYGINKYVGYSTNSNGCVSTDTFTVKVNPMPTADFMADTTEGIAPASIQFINLSTNASNYNWDFGNGDTSKLENPKYSYTKPGVYTVSLKVSGEDGLCEDTLSYWQYITVDQTVGLFEHNDGVFVFPNPATSYLHINGAAGKSMHIYNSIGKLLNTVEITSSNYQLDVSTMPQGTYFYAITGKEVVSYGKFMVR